MNYNIYCFWTGTNCLTDARKNSLEQLKQITECNIVFITQDNLNDFILNDHPLHESYKYLSETHKADYLRTYFMHFYGGGYTDIKKTTGSWKESFDSLYNSDYLMCGYKEIQGGVAYKPFDNKYESFIGNGAYIFKKNSEFTLLWYTQMIAFLDTKLDALKKCPAKHPRDMAESGSGYPIQWNEMLGRIFHRILNDYIGRFSNTLPTPLFVNYR